MQELITTLDTNLIIGLLVLLVIIPIYYKIGLLNWLTGKSKSDVSDDKRHTRGDNFYLDISRELGGVHEKLKVLPEIKTEVKRIADHVNTQNHRLDKVEVKIGKLENGRTP